MDTATRDANPSIHDSSSPPTPEITKSRALVDAAPEVFPGCEDGSVVSDDDSYSAISLDLAFESTLRDGNLVALRACAAKGARDGLGRRSA